MVHIGIGSVIHMIAANAKMAIRRCSMSVSPSIPKLSVGKNQITKKTRIDMTILTKSLLVIVFLIFLNVLVRFVTVFDVNVGKFIVF